MIIFPVKLYNRMTKAASDRKDEEICGLVGGIEENGRRIAKEIYFLENTCRSEARFSVKVKDQFDAVRDMRAKGMKPVGNFHSHPNGIPYPSEEDKKFALDSSMSYIIISLSKGNKPRANSFYINGGKLDREELAVEEK